MYDKNDKLIYLCLFLHYIVFYNKNETTIILQYRLNENLLLKVSV